MPRIQTGPISLNYDTFGHGEPLLLIMGFGLPGAAWLPSLPLLGPFQCIYFDNRGTGNSDKPDGPYTVEQMAEDASSLLNVLGIGKARVFGVSMGGMIAQELALGHPGQVEKLALGCTLAGGPTAKMASPQVLAQFAEGARLLGSDPSRALDVVMPLLYPEPFINRHPELRLLLRAALALAPPTPVETLERLMAEIASFDAYERLERIRCPVMIVHGEADVLIPPENANILKSRIPQAELYLVPDGGHAFLAADPISVHRRIVDFLRA